MENQDLLLGRHCSIGPPLYLMTAIKESIEYKATTLTFSFCRLRIRDPRIIKVKEFKQALMDNNWSIKKIVVHGSYMINLANTFNSKIFCNSIEVIKREIALMEKIGLTTIVVHPGSSLKDTVAKGLEKLIEGLAEIFKSHPKIRIALEIMSNRKKIGGSFDDIVYVIKRLELKGMKGLGVCLDTCHMFASGYDIKNKFDEVFDEFKKKIGLEKLWVIHLNDSKKGLGSGVDRHAYLGCGEIGLEALKKIVQHPELRTVPKLLENPQNNNDLALLRD